MNPRPLSWQSYFDMTYVHTRMSQMFIERDLNTGSYDRYQQVLTKCIDIIVSVRVTEQNKWNLKLRNVENLAPVYLQRIHPVLDYYDINKFSIIKMLRILHDITALEEPKGSFMGQTNSSKVLIMELLDCEDLLKEVIRIIRYEKEDRRGDD